MLSALVVCLLQVSAPDSLTLTEALARARASRGQGAVAAARVAGARAAYRVAGAVPNPIASYSYTESTPRQHVTFDQPFEWLLRRGFDRRAAGAGIERAKADSTQILVELGREVRAGFYRARAASDSERLVQEQSELADSLARLAATRLRAGDISLLEQEQANQEALRARRAVSEARETSRLALAELARAIGWDRALPPALDGELDTGLDSLPTKSDRPADELPVLRAALADSAVAEAVARSASRGQIPFPSLQGGAEWSDPADAGGGALAVIGLSIPLPLWQHGGGVVAQARAQAAQAAAAVREARLEAARVLSEARIRLDESAHRARFTRDSLVPGAHALRARALRAYEAGETGILPVFDAIRGERDIVLAAIQDLLTYQEARADWYALLGTTD